VVPTPRNYKQSVELFEQVLGPAAFLHETGTLCPLNPALNRILVETPEHFI
jgi:hypothetical protein